jgi:general secretion pathway protein D
MRSSSVIASAVLCTLALQPIRMGEAAESSAQRSMQGTDLIQLLEQVAPRLKKRFIVDPHARTEVLVVNLDPKRMTYDDLQAILSVHGFVATDEAHGIVRIVPDERARQLPMPILEGASKLGPEEMVTQRIDAGSLTAAQLVPILRPLLPQYAHLVAHPETNSLIVVARHANVKMIESIVGDLRSRPAVMPKEPRESPNQ